MGFTGGFGIADKWLGNGHTKDQWRDAMHFTGPAVSQLQATFAEGWVEATGGLFTGEKYFPKEPVKEEPAETAGLLNAQPTIGSTPAERFLALSIAGARQLAVHHELVLRAGPRFQAAPRQASSGAWTCVC